jgi:hypothetical protein
MKEAGTSSDFPVGHMFIEDNYIREVQYPAGVFVIGRPHKLGHECRLMQGEVILHGEYGSTRYIAPATLTTRPGYQMVVYTVTAITAITVHPNPHGFRDIDALEDMWFEKESKVLSLGEAIHLRLTKSRYRNAVSTVVDVMSSEESCEVREVTPGKVGVYSIKGFSSGCKFRTNLWKNIAHSYDPNCIAEERRMFTALRQIKREEEITVDYGQALLFTREHP